MCLHEVWSYHKIRKRKGSIYTHLVVEEGGHHFKLWGPAAVMTDLGAQVCKSQPRDSRSALHVQERLVRGEHLGICMSRISLVLRDWHAKFPLTASVYMLWTATLRRKGMASPEHILWKYVVLRAWKMFSSGQVRRSVMSNSLQPHGLQHARPLNFKPRNICIDLKIQRFLMV